MPRALKFELSPLQLPTLHSCSRLVSRSQTHSQSLHGYARSAVAQHCPSPSYLLSLRGRSTFGKYFNAYLKFTVYGRKQERMLPHFRNAVPLVWGSLRLAPIILHSPPHVYAAIFQNTSTTLLTFCIKNIQKPFVR